MKSDGLRIEQKVREVLSKRLKKGLSEQKLVIGYKADKTPRYHKFDIVSDDKSYDKKVIGEVKSYKFLNETTGKAGYTTTRKARLIEALFYLSKVKAKTKLLALTDKELCEQFKKDMDGLLSSDIQIIYIDAK